MFSHVTVTKGE